MSGDRAARILLNETLKHATQAEVATRLGVTQRTVRRWVLGESMPKAAYIAMRAEFGAEPSATETAFKFVDLFAGIGGLRRGFRGFNGECVFTAEWDQHACRTYRANFGDIHRIDWDVSKIDAEKLPDHDLLLAGFPCQPFSLAGVSKKNSLGRAHGFLDKTQGTLFFDVVRILGEKKPAAFLLENVKNLRSHDGGRTYAIIRGALDELGYDVHDDVIDSSPWVPQKRQRIFFAGFKRQVDFSFRKMAVPPIGPRLREILHSADEEPEARFTKRVRGRTIVDQRYTLSEHLWKYLQDYAAKHRAAGNGFGCSVFGPDDVSRTLSARYHKDGSEILIAQKGKPPRRLTPRECARLMGFDREGVDRFVIPDSISDTQAYRQFGNAVVVPVVEELAKLIVPRMLHPEKFPRKPAAQYELPVAI